ncbi:TetR/AcrR family transcriptional regulator [Rhizobium sp. PL01]|uniref:TetR/AcrR family transcriptional regulator n=1 Tax=Rhizobium sp. PL01 TaxID=3085631 RepID=UPI002981FC39|nr:TetR family transcriptional regulator [Rhizobium sp. PL01]MDW5317070.1 TetR family transcriptional regulator [Rhizobium sp. PL01]
MFTHMGHFMEDRRQSILDAGLAILREDGLAGFTQPKVAARAGLRQGNLTYYFPTRTDMLAAVARNAIDIQLAVAKKMVDGVSSVTQAIAVIAANIVRHENTRVLVALNQAADKEPALSLLFNELTEGFIAELGNLMSKLGLPADRSHIDLIHALFVGLSVIDLATTRPQGEARATDALANAFEMLSTTQRRFEEK